MFNMHLSYSRLLRNERCLFCSVARRLGHSHHSEGGVGHVGSQHRGQHAARLPDLQRHVCVYGGFSGLPGQVSDRNMKDRVFTVNCADLLLTVGCGGQ